MRKGLRGLGVAGAPAWEEMLPSRSCTMTWEQEENPSLIGFKYVEINLWKHYLPQMLPDLILGLPGKVPQNREQETTGNLDSVGRLEGWSWDVGRTTLPLKFGEAPSLSVSFWRWLAILGIPSYEDSSLCPRSHGLLPLCLFCLLALLVRTPAHQ